MKFIKVTLHRKTDNGAYEKSDEIVLNIDHIVYYNKSYNMVDVRTTNGWMHITHTDLSRIENMCGIY